MTGSTARDEWRQYLAEAYEGGLDALVTGVDEAVAGGFQRIWLNDHEELAGELGSSGRFVFLFGDAALGMEQFLGLAVNLGLEGAHRGFLEHWARAGEKGDAFWRGLPATRAFAEQLLAGLAAAPTLHHVQEQLAALS